MNNFFSTLLIGRGSPEYLIRQEKKYGGHISQVPRRRVSPRDPRTEEQVSSGGMSGGDRMEFHGYAKSYSRHLRKFLKNQPQVLVECGILKGTGLAVWSELFPKTKLVGLDIDLSYTKENLPTLKSLGAFQSDNLTLAEFDQFKPDNNVLAKLLEKNSVDIVIDDGFHSNETAMNTFKAMEDYLTCNFVYFVEDISDFSHFFAKEETGYRVHSYGELTVIENNT